MKLETSIGLVDDSELQLMETTTETPSGTLRTKTYLHEGEVVKIDQQLDVSEAAMAQSFASM